MELLGSNATPGRTLAVVASIFSSFGIPAEVGMALWTEPIECSSHVEFLLRRHIKECQVDSRTARVAATFVDVFLLEEHTFVEVRIEIGLHARVGDILRPAHEMVNALLRTVSIVDFQAIALFLHVVAHGLQAVCSLFRHQCSRLQIPVNTVAHEVVCAEIADFQNRIRHGVGQCDKLSCVFSRRDNLRIAFCGKLKIRSQELENSLIGSRLPLSNRIIEQTIETASNIFDQEVEKFVSQNVSASPPGQVSNEKEIAQKESTLEKITEYEKNIKRNFHPMIKMQFLNLLRKSLEKLT